MCSRHARRVSFFFRQRRKGKALTSITEGGLYEVLFGERVAVVRASHVCPPHPAAVTSPAESAARPGRPFPLSKMPKLHENGPKVDVSGLAAPLLRGESSDTPPLSPLPLSSGEERLVMRCAVAIVCTTTFLWGIVPGDAVMRSLVVCGAPSPPLTRRKPMHADVCPPAARVSAGLALG